MDDERLDLASIISRRKEGVPAGEFLRHFKRVHGRSPTTGEKKPVPQAPSLNRNHIMRGTSLRVALWWGF